MHKYKYNATTEYLEDLSRCLEGVKQYVNLARQCREVKLYEGNRELSWGLYLEFNEWFYEEGAKGIFAVAFSKLTCNLACQRKSTAQICTKHMLSGNNSLAIPFGRTKDQQRGGKLIKNFLVLATAIHLISPLIQCVLYLITVQSTLLLLVELRKHFSLEIQQHKLSNLDRS